MKDEFRCPACGVVMVDHQLRVSIADKWTCRCGYSETAAPSQDSEEVKGALLRAILGIKLPEC